MFGDISAWMYSTLAGIRPDPANPGFKHIIIKPEFVPDLKWVRAHHDTPYGRIATSWRRDGNKVTLEVTIPPNTTATVFVPGKPSAEVGPGSHQFIATLP
jgi:alpha-L-rhamnosidase